MLVGTRKLASSIGTAEVSRKLLKAAIGPGILRQVLKNGGLKVQAGRLYPSKKGFPVSMLVLFVVWPAAHVH